MDAACIGIYLRDERIRIGRFEFRILPPIQNNARQSLARIRQRLEDINARFPRARFGFLPACQAHIVKEDFANLFRRTNVEFRARNFVSLVFELRHFLRE